LVGQPSGKDGVIPRAFFSDQGLNRLAEEGLVASNAGLDERQE
jgi:hypothetical protein